MGDIVGSKRIINFISDCSIGRLLRTMAESDPKANTEEHAVKEAIGAGEMITKRSIDRLIESQLLQLADRRGVLIDGMPRDLQQVRDFEEKVRVCCGRMFVALIFIRGFSPD